MAVLETDEPGKLQAAQLNTARQFLADNGTRSDTLDNPEGATDPATEELSAQIKALTIEDVEALPEAQEAGEHWPEHMEDFNRTTEGD